MQSACFPSDSYYFNTKSNGNRKLETVIVGLLTCLCKYIATTGTVVHTFISAFVLRLFLKLMIDSLIFSLGCWGGLCSSTYTGTSRSTRHSRVGCQMYSHQPYYGSFLGSPRSKFHLFHTGEKNHCC